jgi:hypothetical protein
MQYRSYLLLEKEMEDEVLLSNEQKVQECDPSTSLRSVFWVIPITIGSDAIAE